MISIQSARVIACAILLQAMPSAAETLPAAPELRPAIEGAHADYLVRSALMSIHDANTSGNYTVLRDLGSPMFQARTASELSKLFSPLRDRKLDLFAAASTMPTFSSMPAIGADQRLHVRGRFPTRPDSFVFDFAFDPVAGTWKYSSLSISLDRPAVSQTPVPQIPAP